MFYAIVPFRIDRFHSRGKQLCKFVGTKTFFTLQKCQSPTDVFLYTNMAAVWVRSPGEFGVLVHPSLGLFVDFVCVLLFESGSALHLADVTGPKT